MIGLIVAFLIGAVVMDAMWAWRLGIPQLMLARWKYRKALRNQPQPNLE
jgi:hypothetical protein